MTTPIDVTNENFESEILNSDVPVLVDFWAAWCGPCKALAPALETLAAEYEGKAKIAKVDVDVNEEISAKFAVRNIPALFVLKNGEVVDKAVGALPKAQLAALLDKHL